MTTDDRRRCDWARDGLLRDYHDAEWGRTLRGTTALVRTTRPGVLSERLSWLIILRKRENFRRAFAEFDVERVATFTERMSSD